MQVNYPHAPTVPVGTSGHQVHPVMQHGPNRNVAVRHPAVPGPNMMAPKADYAELPSGSLGREGAGGIIGGLAPFQRSQGAKDGEFQAPGKSAKSYSPPPAQY